MKDLINKSCPICYSQTCIREKSQCISSDIQVHKKHSFLYFFLSLNLICILGPSSIKWQKISISPNRPSPGTVSTKCQGEAICPQCHQLSLLAATETFSFQSLVPGPCRLPLQPPCPHSKDTLSLLTLCIFLFLLDKFCFSCTALG